MNTEYLASVLIRVFEGVRLTAYQDSGGVWTIGYGHTGNDVVAGQTITIEKASELLAKDAAPLFKAIEGIPMVAAAAYVSFGYNCGLHTLELVLSGRATLKHYVHDRHGNVLPGLVARRELESALITSVSPISA